MQSEIIPVPQGSEGGFGDPSAETRERRSPSLWEQGRAYARQHGETLAEAHRDDTLGVRYGESLVRSKMDRCAANPDACLQSYFDRRAATDRPLAKEAKVRQRLLELLRWQQYAKQEKVVRKQRKALKELQVRIRLGLATEGEEAVRERQDALAREERHLAGLPTGQGPADAQDLIRLEEMAQEYALEALDEKIRAGLVRPEALNASILQELDLVDATDRPLEAFPLANASPRLEPLVRQGLLERKHAHAIEQALAETGQEVAGFVDRRFVTEREAEVILEYAERYAIDFVHAFDRRFGPDLPQRLFAIMRDNARKVAYQTKVDKRTLSGSDHGVRHIYQGNTAFAEQLIASAAKAGADVKPRDAVLVRQIIIDHDLGYTTPAAQAKGGGGAAKDHPCVGCKYVEANAAYYRHTFGEHGFDVIRDVLLNHSYPSSLYENKRPEPTLKRPFTYNRPLIRSIVSTVDSLGVTAETKAMDLFRHPETIRVLQDARLELEAAGTLSEAALERFKAELADAISVLEAAGRVSRERAAAYRQAVERKFGADVIKKTIGQYAGIVRSVRLARNEAGALVPEVRMDVSRLQALVAGTFGEEASLAGFKKALETFGLEPKHLDELGKVVSKLRRETDPGKRKKLLERLTFRSERACFVIGETETLGFRDERAEEFAALQGSFAALAEASPRQQRREAFRNLLRTDPPRPNALVEATVERLTSLVDVTDPRQAERLAHLTGLLRSHADDDASVEALEKAFRSLLSKEERSRLARPSPPEGA